jgi:hypothetical protein
LIRIRKAQCITWRQSGTADWLSDAEDGAAVLRSLLPGRDVNLIFSFSMFNAVISKLIDQPVIFSKMIVFHIEFVEQFPKQTNKNVNRYRVKTKTSKRNHLFYLFIFFS